MNLPESARFQLTPDLSICRILNGMWQVSGAHGSIEPGRAIAEMFTYHDAGFTSWDLADHYGPAEDFIGAFRVELAARRGEKPLASIQAFTKWVPRPARMTRQVVEENVKVSLTRMGVDSLDLLQFHWWEYGDRNYLEALKYLSELCDEGKIKHLALTNFDTEHLQIVADHGIEIVSNQVQYSLVDRRPEVRMAAFCEASGVTLLTYGTLCGGLLSEKYLGRPEPRRSELNTASLMKYRHMIEAWGGWKLFQELLTTLKDVADKHAISLANVGVRLYFGPPRGRWRNRRHATRHLTAYTRQRPSIRSSTRFGRQGAYRSRPVQVAEPLSDDRRLRRRVQVTARLTSWSAKIR